MENQKLTELHKKANGYIYNLESALFLHKKEFIKPGIKSDSQLLIESSREGIHRIIDEAFHSEDNY
ncbi:MAG TPA: hypothetical protein PLB87_07780 [Prolixibacteraceae bacterium]|nr:hypothetical protein [Prolixibacteraceae bacterium]